jgi:hypothetical protein
VLDWRIVLASAVACVGARETTSRGDGMHAARCDLMIETSSVVSGSLIPRPRLAESVVGWLLVRLVHSIEGIRGRLQRSSVY